MPVLQVADDRFFAPLADVWRLFVPDRTVFRPDQEAGSHELRMTVEPGGPGTSARAGLTVDGRLWGTVTDGYVFRALRPEKRETLRRAQHQSKRALYRLLSECFERRMPWGALTGIRPTKLFRELEDLYGAEAARHEFCHGYLVRGDRVRLAQEIVAVQRPYLASGAGRHAIYIGIPFCPSRCRYCSFISQEESAVRAARDMYLPALLTELMRGSDLPGGTPDSVYIGGGTPTVLSAEELGRLLSAVRTLFAGTRELTVEAGRPDTLDKEKVKVLLEYEVDRICVNPQSTSDATLARIGRAHTARQFHEAMELVSGRFGIVNADMILGLPGESEQEMLRTAEDILSWSPQNVTVHALSVKNAAQLAENRYEALPGPDELLRTSGRIRARMYEAGLAPYYLYRQKYMSGGAENVGFSVPGSESRYNIANMEETGSILAFGAGAVSKRLLDGGARIERSANVKHPVQYVERIEEMVTRKRMLFSDSQTPAAGVPSDARKAHSGPV